MKLFEKGTSTKARFWVSSSKRGQLHDPNQELRPLKLAQYPKPINIGRNSIPNYLRNHISFATYSLLQ